MSYLGIDIGTTGCKAVVFDIDGQILSSAYKEYELISPEGGWYELDPTVVIDSCKSVIAKSAEEVKDKDAVKAIGISSQGEAFTILDEHDNYLCNAMVSLDTRSRQQVKTFTESFGLQQVYEITGHTPHTMFSLFKILWLKENCPDIFKKLSKFFCMGDLLTYELTGKAVISYNLASRTMLFDVNKLDWSEDILGATGLKKEVLPELLPAGSIAGNFKSGIASKLNLNKDVVVVTGGHDQSCGSLGAGATVAGTSAYSIGTVECITPSFDKLVLSDVMRDSNLATYPHVVENCYTTVAFNTTGGSLLRWFRDTLGRFELAQAEKTGTDVYDILLADIPTEPTNLFIQPHFAATGTPYYDSNPTGAILGLSFSTTKPQIVKAVLEGISYEMKLNLELLRKSGITVNLLRAFGGGAKSEKWLQIKADIFNIPIVSLVVNEAGCFGAALLAARALGDIDLNAQTFEKLVKSVKTFTPNTENVEKYQKRFEIYCKIYEQIKPLGKMINSL